MTIQYKDRSGTAAILCRGGRWQYRVRGGGTSDAVYASHHEAARAAFLAFKARADGDSPPSAP
ncbi:MAG: hypothetical protein JOZ41_16405, partial [Chloroflexi bacterium]|nr:hypothetical protein [Chloroflexota bacterium]